MNTARDFQDLLVVVRSPESRADRRDAIRNTWGGLLRDHGAKVYYSVHNPRLLSPEVAGDVLMVSGKDGHQNLTPRMIDTFRWALTRPDWTHLFSLDDDCYVVVERMREISWRDYDWAGHFNDPWYISGGPGMFLSRRAVERVLYFLSRDDTAIGAIMRIVREKDYVEANLATEFRPWREVGWPTKDNDTVVQHYVRDTSEMHQLHKESREWAQQQQQ